MESHILPYMKQADCLLVDGTLWRNDEMIQAGISHKLGSEMGHLDQSGKGGIIDIMSDLTKP
jgi:pyrroloquinoline quinone biosynthesis protein B